MRINKKTNTIISFFLLLSHFYLSCILSYYSVALPDKINSSEIFSRHKIVFTMRLQLVKHLLGTDGVVVVMQGEGV